jgi:hypothetical protein
VIAWPKSAVYETFPGTTMSSYLAIRRAKFGEGVKRWKRSILFSVMGLVFVCLARCCHVVVS